MSSSRSVTISIKAELLVVWCSGSLRCVYIKPRRKNISPDLREAVAAAHQSGTGHKAIAEQFEIHHSSVNRIVYKWKAFKVIANLMRSGHPSKFSPRYIKTELNNGALSFSYDCIQWFSINSLCKSVWLMHALINENPDCSLIYSCFLVLACFLFPRVCVSVVFLVLYNTYAILWKPLCTCILIFLCFELSNK